MKTNDGDACDGFVRGLLMIWGVSFVTMVVIMVGIQALKSFGVID